MRMKEITNSYCYEGNEMGELCGEKETRDLSLCDIV